MLVVIWRIIITINQGLAAGGRVWQEVLIIEFPYARYAMPQCIEKVCGDTGDLLGEIGWRKTGPFFLKASNASKALKLFR